jgi:hypothetical protein
MADVDRKLRGRFASGARVGMAGMFAVEGERELSGFGVFLPFSPLDGDFAEGGFEEDGE